MPRTTTTAVLFAVACLFTAGCGSSKTGWKDTDVKGGGAATVEAVAPQSVVVMASGENGFPGLEAIRKQVGDDDQVGAKNRAYMEWLDVGLEILALSEMANFWTAADGAYFNDFKGKESIGIIIKRIDLEFEIKQIAALQKKTAFVDKYQSDPKDYNDEFKKQFPERLLINDEIVLVIKRVGRKQLNEATSYILDEAEKIRKSRLLTVAEFNKEINEVRNDYLVTNSQRLLKDALTEVNKIKAIQGLRSKIR